MGVPVGVEDTRQRRELQGRGYRLMNIGEGQADFGKC